MCSTLWVRFHINHRFQNKWISHHTTAKQDSAEKVLPPWHTSHPSLQHHNFQGWHQNTGLQGCTEYKLLSSKAETPIDGKTATIKLMHRTPNRGGNPDGILWQQISFNRHILNYSLKNATPTYQNQMGGIVGKGLQRLPIMEPYHTENDPTWLWPHQT